MPALLKEVHEALRELVIPQANGMASALSMLETQVDREGARRGGVG
jgi:hypothetical protein